MARSLKKRKQDGTRYERPPDIEAKTDLALGQDVETLRQRAVLDRTSPGYLPSECLVHLIREGCRKDDQPMMNALLPALLKRCEANLLAKVPDTDFRNAARIREEVMERFVDLFFDAEDGDELDFYECRFNAAFRALRIDLIRRERSRVKQVSEPATETRGEESQPEDVKLVRISKELSVPSTQESTVSLGELSEAVNALPEEERKAVVLRHMGYEVESEDPNKETIATLCGVTGRTIRNRLNRAAAELSRFSEEV